MRLVVFASTSIVSGGHVAFEARKVDVVEGVVARNIKFLILLGQNGDGWLNYAPILVNVRARRGIISCVSK